MKFVWIALFAVLSACASKTVQSPDGATEGADAAIEAVEHQAGEANGAVDRNVSSEDLTGRYFPDPKACNGLFAGHANVTIKRQTQTYGKELLIETADRTGIRAIVVSLGEGRRQCLGTAPGPQGVCVETWKTEERPNALSSSKRVTMRGRKIDYTETVQIVGDGKAVKIKSRLTGRKDPSRNFDCRLLRN